MMRRVLLAAAVAAVSLAHAPAAQADFCVLTVELTGLINFGQQVPPRCLPWQDATLCVRNTQGLPLQEVYYEVCLPDPTAIGERDPGSV